MLRSILGLGPKVDLQALLQQGATLIDVRTPGEFAQGHSKGAVNIPLDQLQRSLSKVPRGKPVITCCRSGARSGMAVDVLKSAGLEAYNGGPWSNVEKLRTR
jgi:phage shock protein E